MRESLTVTGTASIVGDIELRESLAERGKAPDFVIVVDVVDAFFHNAKCIIRSGLWDSGSGLTRRGFHRMLRYLPITPGQLSH